MKVTWGKTSDDESEVEDGDNDNMTLVAKSNTVSESDSSEKTENSKLMGTVPSLKAELNTIKKRKISSSEISNYDQDLQGNEDEQHEIGLVPSLAEQVSVPILNEGTLLETDSSNVPSEPRQELKNSGGTILEAVVSAEAGIEEGTSSDPIPETQNDNPQELVFRH
ncbi:hypothetical protein HAX54_049861 [Datura stramonium]|uniref:Uncharacterized protein n=1 Tax=Datura stramonium TaxID=4076 RepID=A0ABS8WN12_DATST|nr:hypothetical protein [Datura stramonium]